MPGTTIYQTEVIGAMMENGVNGLHDVTTTQQFQLGARYHKKTFAPADCVYRYAKSGGACYAGRGAAFWNAMSDGIDWQLLTGTRAIGDTYVDFATGTHPAYTEDELRGGSILISDSDDGSGLTDNNPQNRTITGNNVSAEDAACRVYLDTPLSRATAATTYAFLMPNPYSDLRLATTSGHNWSMAGVPAAYVSAADRYFWVQTWGPCWAAFQSDLGSKSILEMEAVWRWDGSLTLRSDAAAPGAHTYCQLAGYVIDRGNSATFVHLMMSP